MKGWFQTQGTNGVCEQERKRSQKEGEGEEFASAPAQLPFVGSGPCQRSWSRRQGNGAQCQLREHLTLPFVVIIYQPFFIKYCIHELSRKLTIQKKKKNYQESKLQATALVFPLFFLFHEIRCIIFKIGSGRPANLIYSTGNKSLIKFSS